MTLKEMLMNQEITFVTKKRRKEFKVYVSDVWVDSNIIVGWYTDKYGNTNVKQFDMSQYDFYL